MREFRPGMYEHIVTGDLRRMVDSLPRTLAAGVAPVDPADAHERPARHVYDRLRSALRTIKGREHTLRHAPQVRGRLQPHDVVR
jgi:hypothetical protein